MTFDTSIKLSVVVPTKNRPQMLMRAVESCMKAWNDSSEILVIDDSIESPVNSQTVSMICKHGRYFSNNGTPGASAARNIGITEAHGEWLLFLDDDDELILDNLSKLENAVDNLPSTVVWAGGIACIQKYTDLGTKIRYENWGASLEGPGEAYRQLLQSPETRLIFSGVVVRRSAATKTMFNEGIKSAVDREFVMRLSQLGDFQSLNMKTIRVHSHLEEKINVYSVSKAEAYLAIIDEHREQFSKDLRARARFEAKAGWIFAAAGFMGVARKRFINAIKSDPRKPKYYGLLILYSLPMSVGKTLHVAVSRLSKKLKLGKKQNSL